MPEVGSVANAVLAAVPPAAPPVISLARLDSQPTRPIGDVPNLLLTALAIPPALLSGLGEGVAGLTDLGQWRDRLLQSYQETGVVDDAELTRFALEYEAQLARRERLKRHR